MLLQQVCEQHSTLSYRATSPMLTTCRTLEESPSKRGSKYSMWSQLRAQFDELPFDLQTHEYLTLKCCFSRRKSLNYKNRSIALMYSATDRTSNFFNFKGLKLKYFKTFSFANLFFFYNLTGVKPPVNLQRLKPHKFFECDLESYPVLSKLLSESDLYMDFNLLIPTFLGKSLPMIKATLTVRKFLKKKKPIKFLRYIYIRCFIDRFY